MKWFSINEWIYSWIIVLIEIQIPPNFFQLFNRLINRWRLIAKKILLFLGSSFSSLSSRVILQQNNSTEVSK